ncbi:hypothetical protein DL96DRAFT_1638136 [Flagelloscypha sp. PMI_526]|nr:hypothetical protein DL96DRAFT_1638136 [Flagelloscypha sp. PMI_526]
MNIAFVACLAWILPWKYLNVKHIAEMGRSFRVLNVLLSHKIMRLARYGSGRSRWNDVGFSITMSNILSRERHTNGMMESI